MAMTIVGLAGKLSTHKQDAANKYLPITEGEHHALQILQETWFLKDSFWNEELKRNYCLPTPAASPIHFRYRVKSVVLVVPYRVQGKMALEYPYQNGQVQEDLPDCLMMASLYGMGVINPGHWSAFHQPATTE